MAIRLFNDLSSRHISVRKLNISTNQRVESSQASSHPSITMPTVTALARLMNLQGRWQPRYEVNSIVSASTPAFFSTAPRGRAASTTSCPFHKTMEHDANPDHAPIQAWSLRSLANLFERSKDDVVNDKAWFAEQSRLVLQDVTRRLARQHEHYLQRDDWLLPEVGRHIESLPSSASQRHTWSCCLRRYDRLLHVHADTYQLCKTILEKSMIWDRFHEVDQHLVQSTLEQVRTRHATLLETVVDLKVDLQQVVLEQPQLRQLPSREKQHDSGNNILQQLHYTATRFCQARLGIQLLCMHYHPVARHRQRKEQQRHKREMQSSRLYRMSSQPANSNAAPAANEFSGVVTRNAPIVPMMQDAVLEAQRLCEAHYQTFPNVHILVSSAGNSLSSNSDHEYYNDEHEHEWTLTMVRPWLQHAATELLKNAMASSVAAAPAATAVQQPSPPPIQIRLSQSAEWIRIDIIDQGIGGTPAMHDSLSPSSVSARQDQPIPYHQFPLGKAGKWDRLEEQQSYAAVRSPLSGLGVGLHTSQCMIEHFGGTLSLWRNDADWMISSSSCGAKSHNLRGCTARILLPRDDTLLERIPGKQLVFP